MIQRFTPYANRRHGEFPVYKVGDWIWLLTRDPRLGLPCRKLSPQFVGPFVIETQMNPVSSTLALPPHTVCVSILCFRSLFLGKVLCRPLDKRAAETLLSQAIEVEHAPAFRVCELLDSRWRKGKISYLVYWGKYGPKEQFWVPPQISSIGLGQVAQRLHYPSSHACRPPSRPWSRLKCLFLSKILNKKKDAASSHLK